MVQSAGTNLAYQLGTGKALAQIWPFVWEKRKRVYAVMLLHQWELEAA